MRKIGNAVAVLTGLACLTVPAVAQALPSGEPTYEVEGEPAPAPDLVVSATVETDLVLNHEGRYLREVVIRFTVRNQGNRAAGPFQARVSVNHLLWYGSGGWTGVRTDYVSGLAAGASRSLAPVYVLDEACVKALGYADSAKQVVERHETNNFRYLVSEQVSTSFG